MPLQTAGKIKDKEGKLVEVQWDEKRTKSGALAGTILEVQPPVRIVRLLKVPTSSSTAPELLPCIDQPRKLPDVLIRDF